MNNQPDDANVAVEQYKREQARNSAASWFWWIGALSLVNSVLTMNDTSFAFTFGLGVAQIGDAWMAGDSGLLSTLGFFLSFGFSGLFLLLGWLAKHWPPAFLIGMAVYALDSTIFIFAQDWIGVGFHAFALFLIASGYRAYRQAADAAAPELGESAPVR